MKTITFLSVVLAMLMLTGTMIRSANASGSAGSEVHYIVADEYDHAEFITVGDYDRYLLMGFNSTPVIMDITEEEDPFLLFGYEEFEVNGEVGAYLAYPGQAICVAVGFDSIVEIDSINLN